MAQDKYILKRDNKLKQLNRYLDEQFPAREANRLSHIKNNTGNPIACVFGLATDAIEIGISDWFSHYDVEQLRQHFYVSALLMQHYYSISDKERLRQTIMQPLLSQWKLFLPLVSNHTGLIEWNMQNDEIYNLSKVDNHKTRDFFAYQTIVALRGDWKRLKTRCELVLSDPPSSLKTWHDYHQLYYALAKNDINKINTLLTEAVNPPYLRRRLTEEPPYTEHLFITRIIIFMKIAWLHGLEVEVDSPYVPMEWMPMTSNAQYDNHYDFLKPESSTQQFDEKQESKKSLIEWIFGKK